ncbi:MAG: CCA tRNA nucleotidyltransferase [Chloroflexi bacterium]|nr:CCA tRNA nucleotidyltransferase [Chloroflexota bacterium]
MGGPVRDALLGRPIKDLDFCVEGDAPALAQRLAVELAGQTVVHPRFGTATVLAAGSRFDLVTARRETYAHPGALPRVTPSGIRDDLARRDFSINAMAIQLPGEPSEVLDHWGGLEDLRLGVVRTLHDKSFIDDPTRVFRAIRYEQRLGFRIDEKTLGHLKDAVDRGLVAALSPDRLRHEVERILEEENPRMALARCVDLGVLQAVHPALNDLDKLERLSVGAGSEPESPPGKPMVYLAALVSDLSAQEGEELIGRLNMPEGWRRTVRDSIRLRGMVDELNDDSLSPSGLVHLLEDVSVEAVTALELTSVDTVVKQGVHRFLTELRFVEPGLDGRDLLQLGVPPGPLLGRILSRLRDDVLDGRAATDAGRRRLVRRLVKDSMAETAGKPSSAEAIKDAGHG